MNPSPKRSRKLVVFGRKMGPWGSTAVLDVMEAIFCKYRSIRGHEKKSRSKNIIFSWRNLDYKIWTWHFFGVYLREPSETSLHQSAQIRFFFCTLRTFFQFSLELQTIGISIKYRSRRYRKRPRTASNSFWPQSYSTSKLGDRKVPKSFWHFLALFG